MENLIIKPHKGHTSIQEKANRLSSFFAENYPLVFFDVMIVVENNEEYLDINISPNPTAIYQLGYGVRFLETTESKE